MENKYIGKINILPYILLYSPITYNKRKDVCKMNNLKSKYHLRRNLTNDVLKNNGFRSGTYIKDLHHGLIYLVITIDTNDMSEGNNEKRWWTYQVCNSDFSLYIPYYNRTMGKNELVLKLDDKIGNTFAKMTSVFYERKKRIKKQKR